MRSRVILAAAICAAFGLSMASDVQARGQLADQYNFATCDGYGAPDWSADGMTGMAGTYRLLALGDPGDGTRRQTPLGQNGLEACDKALADPALKPKYWLRKVSLIRARAAHRLAIGDIKGALADLDLAETAAQRDDIYYQRSLGVGITLLRAYALRQSGDTQGSAAATMAIWRQRPLNRQVLASAELVLGPDVSSDNLEALLRAETRLEPGMSGRLFDEAFEQGHFADAIALYPALSPPRSYAPAGSDFQRDINNRANAQLFWVQYGGRLAYALAALGRADEALAAMNNTRERLKASLIDPPPDVQKYFDDGRPKPIISERPAIVAANRRVAVKAPPVIDAWSKLVEQRIAAATGDAAAVVRELGAKPMPPTWASIDLLDALAARLPGDKSLNTTALRRTLAARRRVVDTHDLQELFMSLPEAEARLKVTGFKRDKGGLGGWLDGFSVSRGERTAAISLRSRIPPSSIEELVEMRAADLALQTGATGFIIMGRSDIAYSLVIRSMYGSSAHTPDGYSVSLDVLFIDSAHPAPAGQEWRVIDARTAFDGLFQVYGASK